MLEQFVLKHTTVKYIRFQWVDFSGVLHARVIPKARCLEISAGKSKCYLAQNCLIVPISIAPECSPDGPQRWELIPDWKSLRICGFRPSHATVMCYLDHIVPKQESASAKCPRRALERLLAGFAGGPQILVGFEIEFVLLDSDLNLATGLDRVSGYSSMAGLRGDTLSILEEICEALEKADIAVYDFHPEIADQLEVVLSPAEPMQAIDCLMHAQETIRAVAVTHGLRASLAPRPVFNGPQNGSHMHLSLNPLPRSADSFIAGILQNIKALCAFGMPSFDSYVRVTDDGAGCFIGWGTENRDLPIRKITENHWEFRFADATANQYLFMATLLSAGIDGMQKQTKLLWKDCMIFQENLTAEKLKEYGMSEKMPKSLKITIDAAKGHEGLKEWIGETLLAQYLKVKEKELEKFPTLTDEQRRQKYLLFF